MYSQSKLGVESDFSGSQSHLHTAKYAFPLKSTLQNKWGFLNKKSIMIDNTLFILALILIILYTYGTNLSTEASFVLVNILIILPICGALTAKLFSILFTNKEANNTSNLTAVLDTNINFHNNISKLFAPLMNKQVISLIYGVVIAILFFIFIHQ